MAIKTEREKMARDREKVVTTETFVISGCGKTLRFPFAIFLQPGHGNM